MNHLLLVEDDVSLGETLQERLQRNNYAVSWVQTLGQARKKVKDDKFDLIILDVGLPDGSGFDFARDVKKMRYAPFLFMTALSSAPARLEGFEIGAEEFIPKPFHLKEILIRVKHVLETHGGPKIVKVGEKTVDFSRQAIILKDQVDYLPARDFQVLEFLITSAPRVISRDEILEKFWGKEKFPSNRTIDNIIVRLRGFLGAETIRSVRGVGYQWVNEVNRGVTNG